MTVEDVPALSPLASWDFTQLPVPLEELPLLTQLTLHADPDGPAAAALATELGVALPTAPCTFVRAGALRVLWLGPDEWLLVTEGEPAAALETRVRAAVGATSVAVTDVSGQRTALRLGGATARDVLARGCAIDLHESVSPVGTCVQTLLARLTVVLLVEAGGDYLLLVRASFADHLARWLTDVATTL